MHLRPSNFQEMGESTDLRIRTLENPHQYPEGQEAIPIQSRGAEPRGIGLELALGPRDEAWIFQSMHYFFDGSTFLLVKGEFDPIS